MFAVFNAFLKNVSLNEHMQVPSLPTREKRKLEENAKLLNWQATP